MSAPFSQVIVPPSTLMARNVAERSDGRQAAVDGRWLEAPADLFGDEAVHVGEGDGLGWPITDDGDELFEVAAVVAPEPALSEAEGCGPGDCAGAAS